MKKIMKISLDLQTIHVSIEKGRINDTSTSKTKNKIATKKNWKEKGTLILKLTLRPHSKDDSSTTSLVFIEKKIERE